MSIAEKVMEAMEWGWIGKMRCKGEGGGVGFRAELEGCAFFAAVTFVRYWIGWCWRSAYAACFVGSSLRRKSVE